MLRQNRERIEKDLGSSTRRQFLSPAVYGQYRVALPLIRKYIRGRVIDVGAGHAPFREIVAPLAEAYHTLDLRPRADTTFVGDIQDMSMLPDESYDSALCMEVLEHVPDPFRGLAEVCRVLHPNGVLVFSVPHLSRLHDLPYDYYRYTPYGLAHMLDKAGFELLELQPRGGLLTFLGHQFSITLLSLVWRVPGFRNLAWWFNKWLVTRLLFSLDGLFDKGKLFAIGYVGAARRIRATRSHAGQD